MSTIHDVAKKAGVGSITVSRVINRSGYVSKTTREKVEKAIEELGYVPNTVARSLRVKRTNTIALIMTDITNPFFTTLARGVEDTANEAGYTVIFCNTDESQAKEEKYIQILLQKQVDGFLFVPTHNDLKMVEEIQRFGTPVVVIDRRISGMNVDIVRCDSEEAAFRLTRYLLSLGHRRIAILSGQQGVTTADDRVSGFSRAMNEVTIDSGDALILRGRFTQESGYQMVMQLLDFPNRPTALVAANNFITIGAMKALQEMGINVPEEMAITGFDDLPPALLTFPYFTVISQPANEMGRKATELLLKRLANQTEMAYEEIVLPTELIIRKSSGDPLP